MEGWFNSQTAGLIGGVIGSIMGILGGAIGCSCGFCIRKGWKKLVDSVFIFCIAVSAILLLTGVAAIFLKQPYHVWYTFLLPGFIGTIIFSILFPVMRKRFVESELRRMQAKDL